MRCSACGFMASADARFCSHCGVKLYAPCEACGYHNAPGSYFCAGCGAALDAAAREGPPERGPKPAAPTENREQRPERRQVTVLFIDMVGSTELSVRLDDEEFKDVIYRYRDTCATAIRQFDGNIIRYSGDGILACFGFPVAHEDDPVRAVRAALALIEQVQKISSQTKTVAFHVRMGMHTGIVIAGDLRSSDTFETMGILGETPNIASRLQQLAAPDRLVITSETAQLIGNIFKLRNLGAQQIRGAAEPLRLYEVVGERLDAADGLRTGLRMIGRGQELALLQDRFAQAANGDGQLVLVSAEAGAGKTRLVREFRERLDASSFVPITCYCSAYNQSSAFYPVIEMIRRVVNLDSVAKVEDKLANLQHAFGGLNAIVPEATSLVAELLELPVVAAIGDIAPAQRRELLLDVLTQWLLRRSAQCPILFIVEDLHWADASTSLLLERIVQQLADWRAMAIFTYRPDFKAEWLLEPQETRLGLRRLSTDEARSLIGQIIGPSALPADIVDHIVAKASGVPLFIEELTKAVVAGTAASSDDAARLSDVVESIPSTLRGSLAARLDRLKAAKPLAQVAATLGRTFDSDLLGAVTGESPRVLREQLAELLRQGFIQQHGVPVHATYSFRHALIQDAAYDSLLKSERRSMHRKIAEVLSTKFADSVAATPEILAQHYAAGDLAEAAIAHWEAAGKRAAERSANVEAASHFANALAMLRELPDTTERARRELSLEVDRGSQLLAIQGNAAPQVEEVFTRAYELSERLGEHQLLFRALYGLMMFFIVRGQLGRAQQCGVRLVEQADRAADRGLLVQAKRPLGLTLFYLGQFGVAKATLEQALQLYDPNQHHQHRFEYGSDPAVLAQCNLAWTKWFVGLPDAAIRDSAQAIGRAVQLDHPHSLGFALSFEASIRQARKEPAEARDAAERAIELGQTYRFPYWSAWGRILRGWAIGKLGRTAEGLADIEQGLEDYRATGAELIRPYGLMLLAETLAARGDVKRALKMLDEALGLTAANGILFCQPELVRLRGELLLKFDRDGRAGIDTLLKASQLARELGAPSLELRALVSLVAATPRGADPAQVARLRQVRDGFTEGFGTADLIDAARLLDATGDRHGG